MRHLIARATLLPALVAVLLATLVAVLVVSPAWAAGPAEEPAYLTVLLDPSDADLLVDGELQPPGTAGKPLELSPGEHRLDVHLEGYESVWRAVTLQSGRDNPAVRIKLQASLGELWVATHGQGMAVEIDGERVGFDGWNGPLVPGAHRVAVIGPDGDSNEIDISVVAGMVTHVEQDGHGVLRTDAPQPGGSQSSRPYKPPWTDVPRQGMYLYLTGSLHLLASDFVDLERGDGLHGGPAGSLRIGYRVHDLLGIEVLGQAFGVGLSGKTAGQDESVDLIGIQMGPAVRLMVPGRTQARFGATLAGGALYNVIDWSPEAGASLAVARESQRGWNGFGQLEAGVELEYLSVMTTFGLQLMIASSSGLDIDGPLWTLGPLIGFGYGFW